MCASFFRHFGPSEFTFRPVASIPFNDYVTMIFFILVTKAITALSGRCPSYSRGLDEVAGVDSNKNFIWSYSNWRMHFGCVFGFCPFFLPTFFLQHSDQKQRYTNIIPLVDEITVLKYSHQVEVQGQFLVRSFFILSTFIWLTILALNQSQSIRWGAFFGHYFVIASLRLKQNKISTRNIFEGK